MLKSMFSVLLSLFVSVFFKNSFRTSVKSLIRLYQQHVDIIREGGTNKINHKSIMNNFVFLVDVGVNSHVFQVETDLCS